VTSTRLHSLTTARGCEACRPTSGATADEICAACAARIPAELIKSSLDNFQYAVRLRTGETICFSQARISGDWVHLSEAVISPPVEIPECTPSTSTTEMNVERGISVRLTEIVWIVDAPWGS
jgi:hypothetical protein